MNTMSVRHRQGSVRRPVYRRPEWSEVEEGGRSNTWGHGAVRHVSSAQKARQYRGTVRHERSFDTLSRREHLRRRISMVVGAPGTTLVSIAAVVLLVAAAPAVTGQSEDIATPTGTTTVTVADGLSLAEIAEAHVPGVPVGDAVARIASLNDISGVGQDGDDGAGAGNTRDVVVPVY